MTFAKKQRPTKLPSERVLQNLGKSKMTIQDYAKVTPTEPQKVEGELTKRIRRVR